MVYRSPRAPPPIRIGPAPSGALGLTETTSNESFFLADVCDKSGSATTANSAASKRTLMGFFITHPPTFFYTLVSNDGPLYAGLKPPPLLRYFSPPQRWRGVLSPMR